MGHSRLAAVAAIHEPWSTPSRLFQAFSSPFFLGALECSQSSQGSTWQPQPAITGPPVTIGPCGFSGLADEGESVIQRANGVRSATFWMYQHFFFGSQRAPSALASSFSAKGVLRLIRILVLSGACCLADILALAGAARQRRQVFHPDGQGEHSGGLVVAAHGAIQARLDCLFFRRRTISQSRQGLEVHPLGFSTGLVTEAGDWFLPVCAKL